MNNESYIKKAAREAEQKRAQAERLAAEVEATSKRHHFADLGCKFTKYACWCTSLSVGWVDVHGQPLCGNKALTEAKVMRAAAALEQAEEAAVFDVVKLAKKVAA